MCFLAFPFNIAANRFVDEQGNFTMGVNRFAKEQGDLVALQQAKMDKDDSAASKRIEAENRAEREAQDTRNIFERIAGSGWPVLQALVYFSDINKGIVSIGSLRTGSLKGTFLNEDPLKQQTFVEPLFGPGRDGPDLQ